MTEHRFTDAAAIRGARKTQDGYLVAEAFVARSGVQLYRGSEMGLADRDIVRVWRPEDEVMKPSSVQGYSHTPVTMNHPAEFVTSDNWASLAKGEVSTEAEWRDGKLRLPLIVKDADAIAAIEGGTRELSAGYTCQIEVADGVTPEGETYDAIQRDIRINHLAIVPRGRAGTEFRIGDGADARWGASPITNDRKDDVMADNATRTVLIDGLSVVTTDAGAQALEKLQGTIAAKDQALTDVKLEHDKAIAAKDAEIAKKDAAIEEATKKVLSDADLDKRVADRANLVDQARTIAKDVKTAGLSDSDIRKAVVAAKLGDTAITDKSDAYIEARFDVLAEDAGKGDAFANAVKDGKTTPNVTSLDQAYADRNRSLSDAWKGEPAKKEG